jgi:fused signal recognition particle receptor
MTSWMQALARTRSRIAAAFSRVLSSGGRVDAATLEDLEATLLLADVPAPLAAGWLEKLRVESGRGASPPAAALRGMLLESLPAPDTVSWRGPAMPFTVLVLGINGSGKTTTCAKLAGRVKAAGMAPLLAAADTFRAAGSDQLRIWAGRVGCEVVGGAMGADAAAVAYDALEAAIARHSDVLIIDTAGRMHTKAPLMQELQKVQRALAKRLPSAPHETWMVLDASMGQNALNQARVFNETIPLTGAVIAKLDGSAKAGFIFSIARDLKVPIRFVGLGEGPDDLAPFDPPAFVDALLGSPSGGAGP